MCHNETVKLKNLFKSILCEKLVLSLRVDTRTQAHTYVTTHATMQMYQSTCQVMYMNAYFLFVFKEGQVFCIHNTSDTAVIKLVPT